MRPRGGWTSSPACTRGRSTSCSRCAPAASRARATRWWSGRRGFRPGAPASPALTESTRRQLYDIGTFRSAEVTFEPTPAATPTAALVPVDAVVSVQESRRFLFLYGLEATNQYESLFDKRISSGGVAADLRDRNFLGRGWTLGAGLRYEPSFQSGRVLMSVPRIRSTRIRTNVYVDTRTEDRARNEEVIFRDDETSLTIEQRWRVKQPIELSWGYHYEYRDINFLATETEESLLRFTGTSRRARQRHRRGPARQHVRRQEGLAVLDQRRVGIAGGRLRFRLPAHAGPRLVLPAAGAAHAGLECPLGQPAAVRRPATGHGARHLLQGRWHADGARLQGGLAVGVHRAGPRRSAAPSCSCSTRRSGSRCSGC